jgi:hypothetical protein
VNHALSEQPDEEPQVLRVAHEPVEAVRHQPPFLPAAIDLSLSLDEHADSDEKHRIADEHRDEHAGLAHAEER